MRHRFVLLCLLLVFFYGHGQFYYPIQQDAIDFQKRVLLVQLLEEDASTKKFLFKHDKLDDPALAEAYKQRIVRLNEQLKMAISKFWKANKTIEFKTKSEIETLLKDPKILRQYAVLNTGWFTESQFKSNKEVTVDVFGMVAYVAEATDRNLTILKRGPNQKLDYIFKMVFPTDILNLSDFIFAVQQFNYHINNATVEGQVLERYRTLTYVQPVTKVGHEVIRKKTLLIPSDVVVEDTTEKFHQVYTHPFEIKSQAFCEEAIEHQFARYVYFTLVWSDRMNQFAYFVVNASEGIILAELGHKPKELEFSNLSSLELTEKDPLPTYKSRIGLNIHTIKQLEHVVGSKTKE